ncbi:hypothetical protein ACFL5Z_18440 [Planctomycetota bacterium]
MKVICPECMANLGDDVKGRVYKCHHCGEIFRVGDEPQETISDAGGIIESRSQSVSQPAGKNVSTDTVNGSSIKEIHRDKECPDASREDDRNEVSLRVTLSEANSKGKSSREVDKSVDKTKTPETYYQEARHERESGNNEKARDLFTQLIIDHPSSQQAIKAQVHLIGLSKNPLASAIAFPVVLLFLSRNWNLNPDDQFFLYSSMISFLFLLVAYSAWKKPEADEPEKKMSNFKIWLWFIAVANLAFGLLVKSDKISLMGMHWLDIIYIGSGFLVLAAVVSIPINSFTALAAWLSVIVWTVDTAMIGAKLLINKSQADPFIFFVLLGHLFVFAAMAFGLQGLNGIIKIRRFRAKRKKERLKEIANIQGTTLKMRRETS